MNAKSLFVLLLVVVGAVGVYFAAGRSTPAPGPVSGRNTVTEEPEAPTPVAPRAVENVEQPIVPRDPVRQPVDVRQRDPESFAQGVLGRAITTDGVPIENVEVFLVEGQSKNLFASMMLAQRGVVVPPVARTTTDRLGKFALGIEQVLDDKKYEVRLVSDRYADAVVPNLTMLEKEWVNVGDAKMELGASVRGRVTVEGTSGLPIANAEVAVRVPMAFPALSPTPGRERGITTRTDASGFFRLDNVTPGIVSVSAVAAGFAKIERANVEVSKQGESQVDFELPKGLEITGVVLDTEGAVIPGAKVTATAISSKTPMTEETRSDSDGRFEVLGLTEGPFQLTVIAPGFVKREIKPVMAGAHDEEIALERQGAARLRVITRGGRLLTRYDVLLKSFFPEQDSYGNVQNAEMQRVFASDLTDGVYTMTGIDPGQFVFEVHCNGFAKTYSAPFTVAVRRDPDLVTVTLNEGGTLEGVVFGYDGRPLSGAQVKTMPNSLDENPFTDMFGEMIPYKITKTVATTDAEGRYRIQLLAPGEYQLRFAHADHCTVYQKGHAVTDGAVTRVPELRMERGTVVIGTVLLDGAPAGQVKVSIAAAAEPGAPQTLSFNADAITDNDGRFVVQKRLPPGRYQARAARQTLPSPLLMVVDFAKTQQDFSVARGQESHTLHFTLTSN